MVDLDEFTTTDAALEQMANTSNPRLKQIMDAAVRHLHAFVREVELTPAEWIQGLQFLTAVGQAPRNVVQVARMYDRASAGVAACSIAKDRAVVIQGTSIGMATQVWVVQLSNGRVLWTRSNTGDIRTSIDGQYIAEIGRILGM